MSSFKISYSRFYKTAYLVISFFCLSFLLTFSFVSAEVLDKIVATVNGEPISLSEITELKKSLKAENLISKGDQNATAKTTEDLKDLITVILFNREASRLGFQVTDQDVSDYIKRVEEGNGISPGGMEAALKEQGVSMDIYKAKVTREIIKSRVIALNVRSKVQVTDSEVSEKMGNASSNEVDSSKIHIIKFSSAENDQFKFKAIKDKLLSTGSCELVQEKNMSCLDLGIVEPKDLKEDLAAIIEGLSEDEESDIINEENGNFSMYFRVKSNFGSSKGLTFEKIKDQIYQEKFLKEAEKFLKSDLFEKYQVEIINK